MRNKSLNSIEGVVLDLTTTFTTQEFCRVVGSDIEFIRALVDEGILDPMTGSSQWYFNAEDLVRAHQAQRLMSDLGINLAGVALVLDLLAELKMR